MNYGEIFLIIYTVRAVFFILYDFWVYVSVKVSDNFYFFWFLNLKNKNFLFFFLKILKERVFFDV